MAFLAGDSVIRTSLPATGIEGQIVMLISAGTLVPYIYANGAWISTLLSAYPIGSIYMSTVSTNPGTLFGGTWAQLEDRFLLTAGSTYTAGATGGAATVTLSANEIPAHTHGSKTLTGTIRFNERRFGGSTPATGIVSVATGATTQYFSTASSSSVSNVIGFDFNATHEHSSVGGGQAHNNMPPYLTVNVWKRTA